MENASNALIMAGGVLIGVLILSLIVFLYADFGSTSAQILAQKEQQQFYSFNEQFTAYESKEEITIYDIITVIGIAKQNNDYYTDPTDPNANQDMMVNVFIGNSNVTNLTSTQKTNLINNDKNQLKIEYISGTEKKGKLPNYNISIGYDNGRVSSVKFKK